ncbi:DUF2255 family protein [Georgenia sp. SUBG003]|uniref:DUF2255 family protein n=1 Tax=Georgenia sp. SUBG003 TaxID=1497974 RepID=UPI003AB56243
MTIWHVRSGDAVYIRSAHGPDNGWFRRAMAAGTGIRSGGVERDVTFELADPGGVRVDHPRDRHPVRRRDRLLLGQPRPRRAGRHDRLHLRRLDLLRAAGNPSLDAQDLCGTTMGVQTGTIQDEDVDAISTACTDAGDEPIEVLRYTSQADVTTNLVGGKIDIMYADSQVGQYAALQTDDQVEQLGDVTDAAPPGHLRVQGRPGADRRPAGRDGRGPGPP